jgi:hypothetical protein
MTTPDTDTLAGLLADATPGPWVTSETTIHGVKYGGMWVQGADQPDDDGLMKPPLICISGSGGSRSYTTRIVERQDHDDNDANARLIALAPELAAEVIALRAQAAKDKARIERLEAALRPFVAYVHYAFHEGNSRFRLVEDFDEGGGWLGSEDFRRARAALEDGE